MNSVFQQLYMQPSIRRLILGGPEEAPEARPDSVFYQMQVQFFDNRFGSSLQTC